MTVWAETVPDDLGQAGPMGALLVFVLLAVTVLLVMSMTRHLKRLPHSFDQPRDDEPRIVVPDSPAELIESRPQAGQELLDRLRREPRAIEGPRPEHGGGNG